MAGKINYIDDNGKEAFMRFNEVDVSVQGLITFTTSSHGIKITIPVSRLIKMKQDPEPSEVGE